MIIFRHYLIIIFGEVLFYLLLLFSKTINLAFVLQIVVGMQRLLHMVPMDDLGRSLLNHHWPPALPSPSRPAIDPRAPVESTRATAMEGNHCPLLEGIHHRRSSLKLSTFSTPPSRFQSLVFSSPSSS